MPKLSVFLLFSIVAFAQEQPLEFSLQQAIEYALINNQFQSMTFELIWSLQQPKILKCFWVGFVILCPTLIKVLRVNYKNNSEKPAKIKTVISYWRTI